MYKSVQDITRPGDMERIRSLCGICPQHNILYNDLSCREHLRIFANIKGVPESQIAQSVSNQPVGHLSALVSNLLSDTKKPNVERVKGK